MGQACTCCCPWFQLREAQLARAYAKAAIDEEVLAMEDIGWCEDAIRLSSTFRLMSGKVLEGDFEGLASTAEARTLVAETLGWPVGAVKLLGTRSCELISDKDSLPRMGEDEVMVVVDSGAVQAYIDEFMGILPTVDPPSPLMYACMQGNLDAVRMLLLSGSDANEVDEQRGGQTALLLAAKRSSRLAPEMCQVLLGARADANFTDDSGRAALHYAVLLHRFDVCRVLLSGGADRHLAAVPRNGRGELGPTPTQLVVSIGDLDLIEKFSDHVARVEWVAFTLPFGT